MADNKLELVVTVEVDKANQSIKSVNDAARDAQASRDALLAGSLPALSANFDADGHHVSRKDWEVNLCGGFRITHNEGQRAPAR